MNTSEPQMSAVSLRSLCLRKCHFISSTSFTCRVSCISSHAFQIFRSPGSNLKNHLHLLGFWSCIPAVMFFIRTLHMTTLALLIGSNAAYQCPLHDVKPGTGEREWWNFYIYILHSIYLLCLVQTCVHQINPYQSFV